MCSSPHWQVGLSWFREKLSPANREQRLSWWADFAKNCLPRIGSKELPQFREKYRALGRQKMGSNMRPRYIQFRDIRDRDISGLHCICISISQNWNGAGSWNPFSWMTRASLSCIVDTMAANVLDVRTCTKPSNLGTIQLCSWGRKLKLIKIQWNFLIHNLLQCYIQIYRKISNISHTKYQNFNDSRLILQLPLPNPLKTGIKSRMKM